MKKKIFLFLGLLFSFFQLGLAEERIHVTPGHQKVIPAPDILRAAIGNAKVADVKVLQDSSQVIVTGVSKGTTDLILWFPDERKKQFQIRVSHKIRNLEAEVRRFLGNMEGIEIKKTGGRITLDGYLYRGEDLQRVQRALELYPGIVNLTEVHPEILRFLSREIKNELLEQGVDSVEVNAAGDTIHLEGEARSALERKRVLATAKRFFPNVESNIQIGVSEKALVLVDVKMMEIRRNALGEIGLRWPASISATAQGALSTGTSSAKLSVSEVSVRLNALIEKGNARILSNPRLLCRSGTPASFLAGGEVPIRIVGERVARVEFKPYGIRMEVTAHIDRQNRINMEIEAEVSETDAATAVDNIPGFLQNRVSTAASLRMGDTIVLAGLLANKSRKNIHKVPFLGHIPILGELFKSRSYQNNESEFLIFLRPIPAHVGSYVHGTSVQKMGEQMKEAKNEVELSIMD